MKKSLAWILIFAILTCTVSLFSFVFASESDSVTVSTAAELQAVIAEINSGAKPTTTNITLTDDIDCSSISAADWKPLVNYAGVFDGAGHTISNLSDAVVVANNNDQSVDAGKGNNFYRYSGVDAFPDPVTENLYGKCAFAVLAVSLTGTVKDLTVSGGSMSLQATFNKNNLMDLAYLVGYADGATFENITATDISVSTIGTGINENQGYMGYTAVIAGRVTGDVTFKNVVVTDSCTVNTSDTPRMDAAELLGCYDGYDTVVFDNCSADASVTVCTSSDHVFMWTNGVRCDGVAGDIVKYFDENANVIFRSRLSVEGEADYNFYYQTRTNLDDSSKTDYRIICVANTEWVTSTNKVKVAVTFSNGVQGEEKSGEMEATVAYNTVVAEGNGYIDQYVAADGAVVFGWVIVGVPADYAAYQPSVSVVD